MVELWDWTLETLLRRAEAGLPRVNRLTDIYNAVSVLHQVPIGGEDLTRYSGPPRLIRASGHEPLDPLTNKALTTATDDLAEYPTRLGPQVRISRRTLGATPIGAAEMTLPRTATDRT